MTPILAKKRPPLFILACDENLGNIVFAAVVARAPEIAWFAKQTNGTPAPNNVAQRKKSYLLRWSQSIKVKQVKGLHTEYKKTTKTARRKKMKKKQKKKKRGKRKQSKKKTTTARVLKKNPA